jgi:cellobiose transport system permease protein
VSAVPRRSPRRRRPPSVARTLTYIVLTLTLIISAFPIYWTFVVASSTNDVIADVPPPLVPGGHLIENVRAVFDNDAANFTKAVVNSAIVAGTVSLAVLVFSSLAGFAFAKMRFRGSNVLLLLVVASMSIPVQLGVIPLYILMGKLGWNGDLKAVIVPFLVSAFGVFFMRQAIMESVPDELLEAGRIDGCGLLRLWAKVVVPAVRPAAAVLGLFTFMMTWNDFLWPLVTLTPENPTVQVSLSTLASGYYQDYSLVLAGTAIATVPLLVLFFVAGRQLIAGIMEGAVKG